MSLQEILARKRIDIENELLGGLMNDIERRAFSMPARGIFTAPWPPGGFR